MKNYVVVYKGSGDVATFVKGDSIRFPEGQLEIVSEELGTVFVTPLNLIHHVYLADGDTVVFEDPSLT